MPNAAHHPIMGARACLLVNRDTRISHGTLEIKPYGHDED